MFDNKYFEERKIALETRYKEISAKIEELKAEIDKLGASQIQLRGNYQENEINIQKLKDEEISEEVTAEEVIQHNA